MKAERSSQWERDCQQAEAELGRELPYMLALRNRIVKDEGNCQWRGEYAYKLIELDRWCLHHQPRTIVELGAGFTTVVLSRYASEFRCRLITVEENREWLAKVAGWIPEYYRHEALIVPQMRDGDGVRYQGLPNVDSVDLLYVDGPAVHGPPKACLDAVRLVQAGVVVRNLLFDMRRASVDAFREVEGYGFEPGGTYEWSCPDYIRPRRHHTWFWRK